MLVLTRKENESIVISLPDGEIITVTMLGKDRVGIDAPLEINIAREELLERIEES
jgi:carbon storage regulator CsrA